MTEHSKPPAGADPRKKTSRCSDCGQVGHWKGDAECPKVKNGQTPLHKGKVANRIGVVSAPARCRLRPLPQGCPAARRRLQVAEAAAAHAAQAATSYAAAAALEAPASEAAAGIGLVLRSQGAGGGTPRRCKGIAAADS
jgi:hypothetical protein